ncbi:MAG: hypothetical protein ABI599_03905 [Flavobacteriales bacterium]
MRAMIDRSEKLWFSGVALITFLYVVARAILVPFVHDEAATFNVYVPFGEFLPWRSHWDAGNHFLNTALGIVGYKLFGMEQLALRGGNVLSFGLYALMVFRLGGHVRDRAVRWCLWLGLLLCPFLLEFFALFRGYGLEMAFFAWGLYALLCFVRDGRTGQLVQVLAALCFANACILALLPFWAIVLGLLALLIISDSNGVAHKARSFVVWLLLGVVPLVFAARLAMEMQRQGLLYYGSPDGFISVTLSTLCRFVLGADSTAVLGSVVVLFVAITIVALRKAFVDRAWRSPLLLVVVLLWCEAIARIAMASILGVNFPEDRAALHLVPLFIISVALCTDVLAVKRGSLRYAAFILLVLPLRTVVTTNTDHTVLWPEHSPPRRYVDRLLALQSAQDRPLVIGCYHSMHYSLPFAARVRGQQLPLPQTAGFPEGPHDVRIAEDAQLQQALSGFHEVDADASTGLHLLERNTPLPARLVSTHPFSREKTDEEFIEVLRLDSLGGSDDLLVELGAVLSTTEPATINLVVEIRDARDKAIYYDAVCVTAFSPLTDHLREVRRIPSVPGGQHAVVYFWNVRRTVISMGNGSARLMRSTSNSASDP